MLTMNDDNIYTVSTCFPANGSKFDRMFAVLKHAQPHAYGVMLAVCVTITSKCHGHAVCSKGKASFLATCEPKICSRRVVVRS